VLWEAKGGKGPEETIEMGSAGFIIIKEKVMRCVYEARKTIRFNKSTSKSTDQGAASQLSSPE
jgi:hypothetical protein